MEENAKNNSVQTVKKAGNWRRWFRRTNVHIAEFILMLIMMGALLAALCAMLYTVFNLAQATGYGAQSLSIAAVAQIASLTIVAPAALWLYARTTGQEMVQPELQRRTSRTVFLTLWMLGVVIALIGVAVAAKSAGIMALFGFDGADSFGEALVTAVLPGLFSVVVLAFGLWAVVKHPTRKNSITAVVVLGTLSVLVLIAGTTMAVVRKDSKSSSDEKCTYSLYLDGKCTYSEYNRTREVPIAPYDDYKSFDDSSNYIPGSNLY